MLELPPVTSASRKKSLDLCAGSAIHTSGSSSSSSSSCS